MSDSFEALRAGLAGHYQLDRELGRGGMSTVYLARDVKHYRQVAVKVLDPDVATRVGAERFLREIRITAQLQHPNILTLLDSGETEGMLYYVMPFVDGESLRSKLRWTPQLTVEDALGYTREIADALAYAHDHGVVHRDIKPENVLLSHGHAVVADFGVARAISSAKEATNLTMSGFAIGTAAYMSPEQASGKSEIDGRSDVYSLGCVLFEMLAGVPPFVATSVDAVLALQITESPPDIRDFRDDVPDHVLDQVYRALAKKPDQRFTNATEFEESLRGCLCEVVPGWEEPTLQQPLFTGGTSRRSSGRAKLITAPGGGRSGRGLWVAAGALLVVLALVGITWAPWQAETRPAGGEIAANAASIAVLPLQHFGTTSETEYLSDGIADEIINRLARVDGLRVISRTSARALSSRGLTLREIADSLNVDHVLEGAVRPGTDSVRVTVQLIEAATDVLVWSETYDVASVDVIVVHEKIAREVASTLVPAITGGAENDDTRARGAAYDAYLRGRVLRSRRTQAALEEAQTAFAEAIATDSTFAPAYAGLAATRMLRVWYGYAAENDSYRALGEALALADRALRLDSTLAEAYAVRGVAGHIAGLDSTLTLADLDRAVVLQPSSGEFHVWRAMALLRLGRGEEAMQAAELASTLDPVAPGIRGGYAMVGLGQRAYDVALDEARRARLVEPEYGLAELIEGFALLLSGRIEACLAAEWPRYPEVRAMCLYSRGQPAESAAIMDSIGAVYREGRVTWVYQPGLLAAYHAWAGDAGSALEWLRRAYALTPLGIEERFLASGAFDPVWSDPVFRAGFERIREVVARRVRREIETAAEFLQ